MADSLVTNIDTLTVKVYDSATAISGKTQQIILIENLKNEHPKSWYEHPLVSSILIPILVAGLITWIGYLINRKKYKKEVDKLTEETNQIKRDFQPYVLSTLQEIQKEILKNKIDGLRELVRLSRDYYDFDNPYYDGHPLVEDEYEYYLQIFTNFGRIGYYNYKKFIADYEYLYPQVVKQEIMTVTALMEELYASNKERDSSQADHLTSRDETILKQLKGYFDNVITAMRRDLHLDDSFIHEFIEKYKIK